MIRGTTAQFKFKLPYKVEEVSVVTITFWQPGNKDIYLPIKKTGGQCSASEDDPYSLCVSLTPSETMRFSDKMKAKVQLRAEYNGVFFASRQQSITVYPINDEVIDIDPPAPNENGWIIFDGEEITS